ncbi:hypothetical protein LB941_04310 [Ligilactobacillus sp. WILCCON 0076]|uniref:Uncharacterized protein n=1 Tax=Ligilactobacillus ubinensis TaxID=2876789 RepID=A0A9X2JL61_9LACO|nr:hypothetical protein [Ligilactobacillus ubinensis]MCP0886559.1 hypothetical protein [Ligilactobacillus ubinensis]
MGNVKLIGLSIVGLFIVGGATYGSLSVYNSRINASKINISIREVNRKYVELSSEKNDNKKLKALESLEQEYTKYLNSGNTNSKITIEYKNDITRAKNYFKKQVDKKITQNTTKKLGDEKEDSLTAKIKNLKKISAKVTAQCGIVYTSSEVKRYNKKIDNLIAKYNKKISDLAKATSSQTQVSSTATSSSINTASSTQTTYSSSTMAKSEIASSSSYTGTKTSTRTSSIWGTYHSAMTKAYSRAESASVGNNEENAGQASEETTTAITSNEENDTTSTNAN